MTHKEKAECIELYQGLGRTHSDQKDCWGHLGLYNKAALLLAVRGEVLIEDNPESLNSEKAVLTGSIPGVKIACEATHRQLVHFMKANGAVHYHDVSTVRDW